MFFYFLVSVRQSPCLFLTIAVAVPALFGFIFILIEKYTYGDQYTDLNSFLLK